VERVASAAQGKPGRCPDCGADVSGIFCSKCNEKRQAFKVEHEDRARVILRQRLAPKGVSIEPTARSPLGILLEVRTAHGRLTPEQFRLWLRDRIEYYERKKQRRRVRTA
jgi:hypothetical protein